MRFEGTKGYVATDDLKVAVNAAITLERPLLVKGEPGTGKTVLALFVERKGQHRSADEQGVNQSTMSKSAKRFSENIML